MSAKLVNKAKGIKELYVNDLLVATFDKFDTKESIDRQLRLRGCSDCEETYDQVHVKSDEYGTEHGSPDDDFVEMTNLDQPVLDPDDEDE